MGFLMKNKVCIRKLINKIKDGNTIALVSENALPFGLSPFVKIIQRKEIFRFTKPIHQSRNRSESPTFTEFQKKLIIVKLATIILGSS